MSRSTRLLCLLACLALCACDDDGGTARDAGLGPDADASDASPLDANDTSGDADAGVDPLARTPVQDGVDPDGHPEVDQPVAEGQARVGKITGADTGFSGIWSHCRTGDFKLYNHRIAVCIQSETTNRFEVFSGGKLVDARRLDGPSEEVLDFLIPMVGVGTTHADRVEVVRDGSDGGPAVLRVQSHDVALAHLYGVAGLRLGEDLGLEITTEYRLAPDSDTVEIVSWYENPGDGTRSFFVGDWFGYGDRARLFTPGRGVGAPGGRYGWLASISPERSYAWISAQGDARELGLSSQGIPWAASRARSLNVDAGQEGVWRRFFVVGDGTLADIREHAAELRGEELAGRRRTVHVETASGAPLAGHAITIDKDGEPVSWGLTDANGDAQFLLESTDYDVTIEGFAGGDDFQEILSVTGDEATLTVDDPAHLSLQVAEAGTSRALTARVEVRGGQYWEGVAVGGALSIDLAAGDYHVVVSHGPEYDAASFDVTLDAAQSADQSVELGRAFDTDGWLSADFHQHMEPSLDSEVTVDQRVLENASVGVELAVSTDHEAVTDLRPLIGKYDLEGVMTTFPGVEISPLDAHIGVYPMQPDDTKRGRGTVPLAVLDDDGQPVKRTIPELIALARQLPSDPLIQLNHARSSPSGLLSLVDFDPTVGPGAIDNPQFTLDFDTMEIINRFGDTCQIFADWSGLLNAGYRITGLGNSDTHGLGGESGLPRNFLYVDTPVDQLTEADVRDALRAGRVSVGAHVFIDFAGSTLPGDTITATSGDTISFPVQVHTPAWAQADTLLAVANGEVVDTISRPADAGDHLDFDTTVSLSVDRDTWVVFFAYGAPPSGEVRSGKPVVGFTNPVFIDVDGDADSDGQPFEAPGFGPLSLDAVDAFCP